MYKFGNHQRMDVLQSHSQNEITGRVRRSVRGGGPTEGWEEQRGGEMGRVWCQGGGEWAEAER